MTARESVEGWRWDYLTPWGWFPSSDVGGVYTGQAPEPSGWHSRERAVCLRADHHAPHPDCVCGLHAVEELTPDIADHIDRLDAERQLAVTDGRLEDDQVFVIALSRVQMTEVLPGAWPDDAEALASHQGAIADPPHTIRAHRKEYLEVLVDREWVPEAVATDKRFRGWWPPTRYVPDLGAWVRQQCADGLETHPEKVLP